MARGRHLSNQSPGSGRGGGGGRGGARGVRGGGGRGGGGRGRGRGGVWTAMTGVAFDYEAVNGADVVPPSPPTFSSPYPRTVPSTTPSAPDAPATPLSFRGRGGFRGRGRGRPPPPMPYFMRGGKRGGGTAQNAYRQAQADEDVAYAAQFNKSGSTSGSGAATPHFGIGAGKAPWEDRRGFGRSDPNLLKPIIFVKAGTLFQDGQVDVTAPSQDAPSPFQAAASRSAAVTSADLPSTYAQTSEPAPIHLPATFPPSFAPAPAPSSKKPTHALLDHRARSNMDEVDKALRDMAFEEDEDDEQEVETSLELDATSELEEGEVALDVDEDPRMDVEVSPEVETVVASPLQDAVVDEPTVTDDLSTDVQSLFFFDSGPSPPTFDDEAEVDITQDVQEESLFFLDSAPTEIVDDEATEAEGLHADVPVFGDPTVRPQDEEIVWVPPNKKKNSKSALRSNPAIVPPSAIAASLPSTSTRAPVFDDYELSFTSVASSNRNQKKPKYQKTRRGQKKETQRLRGNAQSDEEAIPREGDSDLDWGDDGPPPPKPGQQKSVKRLAKEQLEAEILADYIINTRGSDGEQDTEGMEQFIAGTTDVPRVEIGDIAIENLMAEEDAADALESESTSSRARSEFGDSRMGSESTDGAGGTGWATDDQDPDNDVSDSEADSEFGQQEEVMIAEEDDISDSDDDDEEEDSDQAFLDALLNESSDEEDDSEELYSSDDEDLAAAIARSASARAKPIQVSHASIKITDLTDPSSVPSHSGRAKGKGRQTESEEEEEDVEGGGMFEGNFSWADQDEQFIQDLLEANLEAAARKGRRTKKLSFRAIQEGDFDDLEEALAPAAPISKKSKKASIPASLQAQWDKDRAKKAEAKRERAEARLAILLDPYSSKSKKSRNKAKRSKQAHETPFTSVQGEMDFDSDDDPVDDVNFNRGGKSNRSGITNMVALDEEIQYFLRDLGKTTMSLPPMDKDSRRRIHELAGAYSLKSASKGAGRKRFTTLIKTSRSGVTPNRKKIDRILKLESSAYFSQATWSVKSGSGNFTMPGTKSGKGGAKMGGQDMAKRREGEVVGEGAKSIGQDNLGHKLLSKMGWTEGTRIGKGEDGLAIPIMAIVKNTKTGLGHG